MIPAALAQAAAGAGWRPFLDPVTLPGGSWWLTLIPLALLISVVYKAVRVPNVRRLPAHVLVMTAQIVVAMVVLAAGIHAVVLWIVPALGG
ncbi:MAG: hypothetical protein D6693_07585 [Planctomycetota bacterium]|nr:MAG: hypothetical protein D6693_07585 [Planctomycetota bacterium]